MNTFNTLMNATVALGSLAVVGAFLKTKVDLLSSVQPEFAFGAILIITIFAFVIRESSQ